MKKFINLTTFIVMLCMLATMACGCSGKSSEEETVSESTVAEATIAPAVEPSVATAEAATTTAAEEPSNTTVEATIATVEETSATTEADVPTTDVITDEMAVDAITTRCVLENPDLTTLMAEGEYTFYWEVVSSTDSQVVVLYRSYTGAEIRYYIDRVTGDTTVTELVPGIIDEEQATDESFNARDFLAAEIYG